MNRREQRVKERYEQAGWSVVTKGGPDLTAYGFDPRTGEYRIVFIEVKAPRQRSKKSGRISGLQKNQEAWAKSVLRFRLRHDLGMKNLQYRLETPKKSNWVRLGRRRDGTPLLVQTPVRLDVHGRFPEDSGDRVQKRPPR